MSDRDELIALRRLSELEAKAGARPRFEMPEHLKEEERRQADPLAGTSAAYRAVAGYGKAGADIARGIGQGLGLVSREDVAEARRRDEPLMRSGAGMAGNIAGNIAALVPTSAIPGAATLRGAAKIGAGIGAISPSASTEETALNVLSSAGLAAGGQAVAGRLARGLRARAPGAEPAVEAIEAGFGVPPSQVPGAGIASRAAEGFGGKLRTAQEFSAKNQNQVNRLIKSDLGLDPEVAVDRATLSGVRRDAGKAYEAIKRAGAMSTDDAYKQELARIGEKYRGAEADFPGLGKTPIADVIESLNRDQFSSSGAIDAISILRDKADVAGRGGDRGLAKAMREAAKAVEDVIERNLEGIASETGAIPRGAQAMLAAFRAGRTKIAKVYAAEKALNETTGNFSAAVFAQELKRGKPLTGGMRTVGRAAQAFPKAFQRPEIIGSQPPISPLDVVGGGILGGAGAIAGGPAGLGAAAIPMLRPVVRAGLLSRPYQRGLAAPRMLSRLPGVSGNEALIEEMLRRSSVPLALSGPAAAQ